MASVMTAPSRAIRATSQWGTRPPWSGRSALPVRLVIVHSFDSRKLLKVTEYRSVSTGTMLCCQSQRAATIVRAILAVYPGLAVLTQPRSAGQKHVGRQIFTRFRL